VPDSNRRPLPYHGRRPFAGLCGCSRFSVNGRVYASPVATALVAIVGPPVAQLLPSRGPEAMPRAEPSMRRLPRRVAKWIAGNVVSTLFGAAITAFGGLLLWKAPWYTPLIYVAGVGAAFGIGWLVRGPGPEDLSEQVKSAEEELDEARRREYYVDHVRDTLEELRAHRAGELEGMPSMEFCERILQFAREWIKDQAGVDARLAILKSDGRHYRAAAAAGFKSSDKSTLRLPTSSPFEKLAREDETLTEVRLAPRPSRRSRSSRRTGPQSSAPWRDLPNSRRTRSSSAQSSATCCQSRSATAWA